MRCQICSSEMQFKPKMKELPINIPLAPGLIMEFLCPACGHIETELLPPMANKHEKQKKDVEMITKEGYITVSDTQNPKDEQLKKYKKERTIELYHGNNKKLVKELTNLTEYLNLVQKGEVAETLQHLQFLAEKEKILKLLLTNDPMQPDSKIILNEPKVADIVKGIGNKLTELNNQYKHFRNYDPNGAVSGTSLIWYQNNLKYKPNPKYEDELLEKNKKPLRKKAHPHKEIVVYSDEDSIDLYIKFTDYESFKTGQRLWLPDLWICNHAVEINIKGADTKEITEIRDKVYGILLDAKIIAEK